MLIEIVAIIGLDPVSTNALENLQHAAEILKKEYGIKILIVPYNTWSDTINSSIKSLPIIVIGGSKAFTGYAPSVKEIIKYVLDHVKQNKRRKRYEALVPAGIIEKDHLLLSAAIT
ncbi:MAG: hypothetical protein QXD57_04865 [Ignisphaera sp.]|uniref:Uncharacterized protein n=1 Tax=Ignisphaera aggregans TaxID=334771 RepID=A0A7C4D2K1_9CREN